ncbi:MAG TPA: SDR family oxidoreductase [Solimonas sp.]
MTRTLLITGASSGYGKATAQHFLDRGWNVVATMRRPAPELFNAPAERLRVLPLDVTDPSSIDRALDQATAAFGSIDVLVNNAGIGLLSALEHTPDETVREVFETNTFGVINACRAAIPRLRRQPGKGTIINVTSSVGIAPMPLVAVYTASKTAIEGFSESLAYEMAYVGIPVKIVQPGFAPSTRFAANGADRMQGLTPAPYDAYAQAYFARMQDYPTAYASERDIAEAVYRAATEPGGQLRYPAGADAELLTELRVGKPEGEYLSRVREMFAPKRSR